MYLGRDAVSGRKRWAYRTFRGGKREAQRALSAMVAEADRGGLARTTSTVGALLEEWFEHAAPSFSPKNVVETRGMLDRNLLPFLGSVILSKLGAADLDRFYRRLADNGVIAPVGRCPPPRSAGPTGSCTEPRPGRALGLAGPESGVVGLASPGAHARHPPAITG